MMNVRIGKRSLKKSIYLSYFGISMIGLTILIVAALATSQLKNSSTMLADQNVPNTVALLNTQVGLNRALASLRGWVAIKDLELREDNLRAWEDDILPAIALLDKVYTETSDTKQYQAFKRLKLDLADLKEWQWYISEAAVSEGNHPAQIKFDQHLTPIYNDVVSLIEQLIAARQLNMSQKNEQLMYTALVECRNAIIQSQLELALFSFSGDEKNKQEVLEQGLLINKSFQFVKELSKINNTQQTELIALLEKHLKGFHVLVAQIISLRSENNWDIANDWLRIHALPLSREINDNLQDILNTQTSHLRQEVESVIDIGRESLLLFVFLLFLMIVSATLLARFWAAKLMRPIQSLVSASKELTKGNLNFVIDIQGDDELSELAHSFDEMRLSLAKWESELSSSETRLKTTIATVLDAIIVIDDQGIIQSLNPAASELFSYEQQALLGRNIKMLMPQPYQREHDGYLKNYRDTNEPKIIGIGREVVGLRSDGTEFPLMLSVNEMLINGEKQFVGLVRDITEQKKVDKMKSEFISVVSHELRTPLTSIRGSLGLLVGGAAGEINEKFKSMLDIAVRNTDRLIRLINEILDIEKIESGKIVLKKKRIIVTDLLKRVVSDNEGMAIELDVTLKLDDVSSTLLISADVDRMNQVATNLISNAIKYSPKGGVVTIGAELVAENVVFSVTDTGAGIPEDFIPKIFQKFNQADSSATREKGGTGLGLSIAKALVEQHDGSIGFETSSAGTRFYFSLPVLCKDNYEVEKNIIVDKNNQLESRILICEDDKDVANLLSMILAEQGFVSDKVYSAEEALLALDSRGYAALLLDLNLPGMSGLSLMQELRSKPKFANLPIVVVSAIANEIKQQSGGEAFNVVGWLEKPINVERLFSVLKSMSPNVLNKKAKILYVEDDESLGKIFIQLLKDTAEVEIKSTISDARIALQSKSFDLAILDIQLPDGSGLDLIPLIKQLPKPIPIIVFSAQELPEEYEDQVAACFIKANGSNDTLINTIRSHLS